MTDLGRSRLFLAVALDTATRNLLAAHLDAHGWSAWPGRAVPPPNWHVTLRFLGWTSDVQRDKILRHLDEAELPDPFLIGFGGLGAFPKPSRATVIWLGVQSGAESLQQLAAVSDDAGRAAGFQPEERPYHAHLTLGRVRPPADVTDLLASFPPFAASMRAMRVTLFASHLERSGASYEAIDAIDL